MRLKRVISWRKTILKYSNEDHNRIFGYAFAFHDLYFSSGIMPIDTFPKITLSSVFRGTEYRISVAQAMQLRQASHIDGFLNDYDITSFNRSSRRER